MRIRSLPSTAATLLLALLFIASPARGGELIELTGVHLCCNRCVTDLRAALADVKGIDKLDVNRREGRASFVAQDDEAIEQALEALAAAGYYGTAKRGDEPIEFAKQEIEEGAAADRVVLEGVHLCCGGCAKAVVQAYAGADDVVAVDCDLEDGIVTLTGKKLAVTKMIELLHEAGFHGRWVP